MKSYLQQYEAITRYLLFASLALVGLGSYLYTTGWSVGAIVAIVGVLGLGWCFLRR